MRGIAKRPSPTAAFVSEKEATEAAVSTKPFKFCIDDVLALDSCNPAVPDDDNDGASKKKEKRKHCLVNNNSTNHTLVSIPQKKLFYVLLGIILFRLLFAIQPTRMMPTPTTLRAAGPALLRGPRRHRDSLPQPGEYAPLPSTESSWVVPPLDHLITAPTSDYHIFLMQPKSSSWPDNPPVLINILMGLFDQKDEHVAFTRYNHALHAYQTLQTNQHVANNVTIVSHTVEAEVSLLERAFRRDYRHTFYAVLLAPETKAAEDVADCHAPMETNMLCLEHRDLFYDSDNVESIRAVVGHVVERIRLEWPYFSNIPFDTNKAIQRLKRMRRMLEQMQDVPMSTFETKYGIHGLSK